MIFRYEGSKSRWREEESGGVRDSVTNEVSSDGGNASSGTGEGAEGGGQEGEGGSLVII